MGCDGSRPADCSRRVVLRRRSRGPAPIVVRRVAGTMRSADDAERKRRRDSALATGQMAFCSCCCCRVSVEVEEADVHEQSSEYVKQIDELTSKLTNASSLIAELRQQQVSLHCAQRRLVTNNNNNTRLTAFCPGLPWWAGTRKVKPIWILLKQETVSGSGISWAVCKSAPRSGQITTPAPHHSVFYTLDALPAAQLTVSKH